MLNKSIKAIEFFSGIGAFHEAAKNKSIEVVQAFDQSSEANRVYQSNFGLKPEVKNLVSISSSQIEEAQLWWMSPPCTPFSRRGKQLDDKDPRALAFLNLIEILDNRMPEHLIVENVDGFLNSAVYKRLIEKLENCGYNHRYFGLCSTQFGVPMRRPRTFVVASKSTYPSEPNIDKFKDTRTLEDYLKHSEHPSLTVSSSTLDRYHNVLNIVDPAKSDTTLICFTSGYYRCNKASGSLLKFDDRVGYVHPIDILKLLGFNANFAFPPSLELKVQFRLVGNSVDVRAINYLLSAIDL